MVGEIKEWNESVYMQPKTKNDKFVHSNFICDKKICLEPSDIIQVYKCNLLFWVFLKPISQLY